MNIIDRMNAWYDTTDFMATTIALSIISLIWCFIVWFELMAGRQSLSWQHVVAPILYLLFFYPALRKTHKNQRQQKSRKTEMNGQQSVRSATAREVTVHPKMSDSAKRLHKIRTALTVLSPCVGLLGLLICYYIATQVKHDQFDFIIMGAVIIVAGVLLYISEYKMSLSDQLKDHFRSINATQHMTNLGWLDELKSKKAIKLKRKLAKRVEARGFLSVWDYHYFMGKKEDMLLHEKPQNERGLTVEEIKRGVLERVDTGQSISTA